LSRWSAALLIRPPREDLCLSYANTLSWRGSDVPVDKLADFADLLSWLASSAGLLVHRFDEAAKWSSSHPEEAARLFVEAIAAREAIYCIFSALASGNGARDQDLDVLNRGLETAPMRTRLARARRGYAWRAEVAEVSAPALLAPILWSAGDLLVKNVHERIRQCANEKCLWLFLDESKNGTRRWCDMTSCGNRAKARRHYLKAKQG
jgi:predicted RNA-binding Zn ribbon-like protein